MKVNILVTDKAKEGVEPGHGLSLLLENGKKILFDTGPEEVVLKNAKKMKKMLSNIDFIVLSHGHLDHADGLLNLIEAGIKPKTIVHPSAFVKRYIKIGDEYTGMPFTKFELEEELELIVSKEPYKIDESITFLGEIPRRNDFEARSVSGYYFDDDRKRDDKILDDSALAIKTDKGLVIITGCSHSGICNIIDYAKSITNEEKIYSVIGGLHLTDVYENVLRKTIEYLKKEGIERFVPLHCVDEKALEQFGKDALKFEEAKAGDVIEL